MATPSMTLKILLPSEVFASLLGVKSIVAETRAGSFGLLPSRLDCVASLVPGILTYETAAGGTVYVAVDEGILVKSGFDVSISVRSALGGTDLGTLRAAVERQFVTLDAQEKDTRMILVKMESGLVRRLADFDRESGG